MDESLCFRWQCSTISRKYLLAVNNQGFPVRLLLPLAISHGLTTQAITGWLINITIIVRTITIISTIIIKSKLSSIIIILLSLILALLNDGFQIILLIGLLYTECVMSHSLSHFPSIRTLLARYNIKHCKVYFFDY